MSRANVWRPQPESWQPPRRPHSMAAELAEARAERDQARELVTLLETKLEAALDELYWQRIKEWDA